MFSCSYLLLFYYLFLLFLIFAFIFFVCVRSKRSSLTRISLNNLKLSGSIPAQFSALGLAYLFIQQVFYSAAQQVYVPEAMFPFMSYPSIILYRASVAICMFLYRAFSLRSLRSYLHNVSIASLSV